MTPIVATQVELDIKPKSETNCINQDDHGVIPVAIYGAANFQVEDIDPNSLSLQGVKVKKVGKTNKYLVHTDYVDGDEHIDLIVQLEDSDGWIDGGGDIARLSGELYDGTPIAGDSYICIVP